MDLEAIPSVKVHDITKAYKNYVRGKEPQYAPLHALDLAFVKLRESVPEVETTLVPQIKGGLVVDLHKVRVVPKRSASEKRQRDPSVGSTETATKKGKASDGSSQPSKAQSTKSSGGNASRSKSQPPKGRARSSSKGRSGAQQGKTSQKGGAQGQQGQKGQQTKQQRPSRSRVGGQGRFYKGW